MSYLYCIHYLLHQGLALCGHKKSEGNLYQLLLLRSCYDSSFKNGSRKISLIIVNELISTMGLSVLRTLLKNVILLEFDGLMKSKSSGTLL